MKFLVFSFLLTFGTLAFSADDNSQQYQAPPDYNNGTPDSQMDPQMNDPSKSRVPNGADLPYSDEEIQKNAPENDKSKNMPIDQD